MNSKTVQEGKYTITISSNEPNLQALLDFDRKLKKLSDNKLSGQNISDATAA